METEATALRQRLFDTFMDYARQAQHRREWEAAQAYIRAADLALGTTVYLTLRTKTK